MAKTVDAYLAEHANWAPGLQPLRALLLDCGLEEGLKWGAPAYMLKGRNVVQLVAFKAYFGLWFAQGALLKDPLRCLVNAQEGKTQALRQWRFDCPGKVDLEQVRHYVEEAIANAREGKVIAPRQAGTLIIPAELQSALDGDSALAEKFASLTPGRQREYAEHIGSAKREATRLVRLEKAVPLIRDGAGLHEKYRA